MQKIYKIKNFQVNISACQGTYISLRVYFGCIFCLYIYENEPKMPFFKQKSPKRGFFRGAGDESRTRRNQLGKLTPYR